MKRSIRNKLERERPGTFGPESERAVDLAAYTERYQPPAPRSRYNVVRMPARALAVERRRARGQALLIIALMMTVLILFVGLGVDVGNLMARRAKLQSAVDSSALSAAQLLTGNDVPTATVRVKAYQILQTNGVPTNTLSSSLVDVRLDLRQVQVRAVQRIDTYFMRIVPMWRQVDVSAEATADLNAFAEMNIKPYGRPGVVNELQLQTWGPWSWRRGGDAYSPVYIGGGAGNNPEYDEQPYGYLYRIDIPPDFPDDSFVLQIFDPDTYNRTTNPNTPTPTPTPRVCGFGTPCPGPLPTYTPYAEDSKYFWCRDASGNLIPNCTANDNCTTNPAIKLNSYTGPSAWNEPPWTSGRVAVWRVDEYRRPYNDTDLNPGCNAYDANWPTETQFSLWHFDPHITSAFGRPEDMSDQPGSGPVVTTYTVRLDTTTDLAWYQPWPAIQLTDPSCSGYSGSDCFARESNGNFYFYLYVKTSNGSSENDYDLRVGPKDANYSAGYDCTTLALGSLCYSNQQFFQQSTSGSPPPDWDDGGARIFAKRALPLNLATGARFPLLYTQVSKQAAGQTLAIRHFDQDCPRNDPNDPPNRPCGWNMSYEMQVCVDVGTTNLCSTGNCEPCSELLNPNCYRDLGLGYFGPNNGWYCSGCPAPEQVQIPVEGTGPYMDYFGPNGECATSWLRLEQNPSYSNDTTVWEMPYRRPRLIK